MSRWTVFTLLCLGLGIGAYRQFGDDAALYVLVFWLAVAWVIGHLQDAA